MSDTTRLGLSILGVALVVGILGDALLRTNQWGINLGIWVAVLILSVAALARWQRVALTGGGRWLALPALFFAAALAWRDSLALALLNVLALLVALGLATFRARGGRLVVGGLAGYALDLFMAGIAAGFGCLVLLIGKIRWVEVPREGWSRQALAVGWGLVIALPLLLIFSGLFMAADAVFDRIVGEVVRWIFRELFLHLFVAGLIAWLVAGALYQTLLVRGWEGWGNPQVGGSVTLGLGIVPIAVVLGLLDLLFLLFVAVQFRYLFGGAALVEVSPTLTYAEYARRGFFELVTVAALALPLLLLAEWLARDEKPVARRVFQGLAGALVGLLGIIMVSAVQRLRLYQDEYGLTEQRLYATAFLGWLAIVLLWFVVTVLPGQRQRFTFGGLIGAFAVIAALNVINPDDLIVRANLGRATVAQPFDARYVATLSADAVPALVENLALIREAERRQVAASLVRRWSPPTSVDWRAWNWSRAQAWRAVGTEQATLQDAGRGSR